MLYNIRQCYIMTLLLALVIFGSGCVRDFDEGSHMYITNTELSAHKVASSFIDLNITTYVFHESGVQKSNASLELKVFDRSTGLLELRKTADVGFIKEGETSSISQSIRLPKEGQYRIESVLYEGNKTKYASEVQLSGLEGLKTDVQEIGIGIDSMDFLVRKVVGNNVVIENDIYLTNAGSNVSEDYKVLVKAREMDARLIADKIWTTTGIIGPEETIVRSVNLTVPDNYNYAIEVIIWKDNTIVKRGEDYVQLDPEKVIDKDKTVGSKDVKTSDFVVEEKPIEIPAYDVPHEGTETPGFGSVFAIVALITAFLTFRRRYI